MSLSIGMRFPFVFFLLLLLILSIQISTSTPETGTSSVKTEQKKNTESKAILVYKYNCINAHHFGKRRINPSRCGAFSHLIEFCYFSHSIMWARSRVISFVSIHSNNLKLMLKDINGIYKIVIATLCTASLLVEEKGLGQKILMNCITWNCLVRTLKSEHTLHLKYSWAYIILCVHVFISIYNFQLYYMKCSTKSTQANAQAHILHTWTHWWLESDRETNPISIVRCIIFAKGVAT